MSAEDTQLAACVAKYVRARRAQSEALQSANRCGSQRVDKAVQALREASQQHYDMNTKACSAPPDADPESWDRHATALQGLTASAKEVARIAWVLDAAKEEHKALCAECYRCDEVVDAAKQALDDYLDSLAESEVPA